MDDYIVKLRPEVYEMLDVIYKNICFQSIDDAAADQVIATIEESILSLSRLPNFRSFIKFLKGQEKSCKGNMAARIVPPFLFPQKNGRSDTMSHKLSENCRNLLMIGRKSIWMESCIVRMPDMFLYMIVCTDALCKLGGSAS